MDGWMELEPLEIKGGDQEKKNDKVGVMCTCALAKGAVGGVGVRCVIELNGWREWSPNLVLLRSGNISWSLAIFVTHG